MHRLVQPQPLDVGPLVPRAVLPWHLLRIEQGLEAHVFRSAESAPPRLSSLLSWKPSQGITIDHASTQRSR